MSLPLREDTAFTMSFGPVINTAGAIVTSISTVTLVHIKNGTPATQASFTVTHVSDGIYTAVGTTTHSNTAGRLELSWADSASYMSASTYTSYSVLRPSVWDTLYASGNMPSDIVSNTLGVSTFDYTSNQVIVGTNNVKTGYSLTSADHDLIATAALKLDWNGLTGEAAFSALNALRTLRNVFTTTAGTYSVMKEDGITEAWSTTYTTDAAAEKIISRG